MKPRSRTDFLVVHCSAHPPTRDIGAAEIRREHMAPPNNWRDIGYHFVIRRNGAIETGRALEDEGSHVKGFNHLSVGICLVGGIDAGGKPEDNFTDVQKATLKGLLLTLLKKYPKAKILGHRDFSPDTNHNGKVDPWERIKECPCFEVAEWWRAESVR